MGCLDAQGAGTLRHGFPNIQTRSRKRVVQCVTGQVKKKNVSGSIKGIFLDCCICCKHFVLLHPDVFYILAYDLLLPSFSEFLSLCKVLGESACVDDE